MGALLNKLINSNHLNLDEWIEIIKNKDSIDREKLFRASEQTRKKYYGNKVYIRGLIEFSNFCKNNFYYCVIRRSNYHIKRYRL